MNWFRNRKTRSKLILSFGVMVALTIGLCAMAYYTMAAIQKNERETIDETASGSMWDALG